MQLSSTSFSDGEAIPGASQDLLLASHPALLEPEGSLAQLPAGGAAVVLSTAESSEDLARLLGPEAREAVREREIRSLPGHVEGHGHDYCDELDAAVNDLLSEIDALREELEEERSKRARARTALVSLQKTLRGEGP